MTVAVHEVFVVHANSPLDKAFVRTELVPALQLEPAQLLLSSELPLGQTIIDALETGITGRVTVVVLSPNLLHDTWAAYGELLASHLAVTKRTVVPILLSDCQLPPHLQFRVLLDCREPSERPEALRRLRELITPSASSDQRPAAKPAPQALVPVDYLYTDRRRLRSYFEQLTSRRSDTASDTEHHMASTIIAHLAGGITSANASYEQQQAQLARGAFLHGKLSYERFTGQRAIVPTEFGNLALWIIRRGHGDESAPYLFLLEDFSRLDDSPKAWSAGTALASVCQSAGVNLSAGDQERDEEFAIQPAVFLKRLGGRLGPIRTIEVLYRAGHIFLETATSSRGMVGYAISIADAPPLRSA